jgi:DNA-binding beta-propeller fold protein YncE
VADQSNHRIQIFGLSGNTVTHQVSYGSSGTANGQFSSPYDISFSPDGTRFAVTDNGNYRIQIFGLSGNTVTHQVSYGSAGSGNGQFSTPRSISFSPDGTRFAVTDYNNKRVQIL